MLFAELSNGNGQVMAEDLLNLTKVLSMMMIYESYY